VHIGEELKGLMRDACYRGEEAFEWMKERVWKQLKKGRKEHIKKRKLAGMKDGLSKRRADVDT